MKKKIQAYWIDKKPILYLQLKGNISFSELQFYVDSLNSVVNESVERRIHVIVDIRGIDRLSSDDSGIRNPFQKLFRNNKVSSIYVLTYNMRDRVKFGFFGRSTGKLIAHASSIREATYFMHQSDPNMDYVASNLKFGAPILAA